MRIGCAFSALLSLAALGCEPVDPSDDRGQPSFADRELALRRGPASLRDAVFDGGRATSGLDASGPVDAGARCGTWRGRTPIRALFVGNSQLEVWGLPDLVADLAASAPASCPRIEPTSFTLGGANLHELWTRPLADRRRLPETLARGGFDVVVIAESIDLAEHRPPYPEQFVSDATHIIEAARAAGSVPVLYATPFPEWGGSLGFHLMTQPQLELGQTLGVTVAAGGLAWLRVWSEAPRIDLYGPDRAHPNHEGSYLSALTIYAAITGASPIGLTHDLVSSCGASSLCPRIRDPDAELFQRAAWAQHLATGL